MADIKQNTAVKPQVAGAFDGDQYHVIAGFRMGHSAIGNSSRPE